MLYQQLDYPLVPVIYSLHEGRPSILYRIGKDRIRVEKKKGEKMKKRDKQKEKKSKRVRRGRPHYV